MGLTLIELMVAMALLGVVGVLTWRATSQLVDARERIGAELSRWQAVVHASALIERELMQIAPPALAEGTGPSGAAAGATLPALELEADPDGRRSRLAWTVVGGEQGFGRFELRHQDQRLEALVWPDREARGEAVRLPLLDGVDALRWRLLAAGQAHTQWPAAESRSRRRGRVAIVTPLPEAVEFTLELADVGTVVRVFALR
ncbi:hypothetical protein MASR2M50_26360 [Thauera sp.]